MQLNELDIAFFKQLREGGQIKRDMQHADVVNEARRFKKALEEVLNHPRTKETGDIARKALLHNDKLTDSRPL
jgi:hypothetical protein